MPADLNVPDLPYEVTYIWEYFLLLNAKRSAGLGSNPLSEVEMEAWQRRRGIQFDPFEIECIDALDRVYLDCAPKPAGQK